MCVGVSDNGLVTLCEFSADSVPYLDKTHDISSAGM
jgi:hypothetical protein